MSIEDFTIELVGDMPCVRWSQIENKMGLVQFKQFGAFITGQTCMVFGDTQESAIYAHDLDRFLRGLPVID